MKTSLSVVCLFAWVGSAFAADPVITFDDIPDETLIPVGYHLLNWPGFQCVDGAHNLPASGLQPAVVSGFNVVFPRNGNSASITAGMFDLLSVYATSVYNDNLQLEAKGYIKGTLVYDQTNTLSATAHTLLQYNFYGVDEVDFVSSGGTLHGYCCGFGPVFALDNVSVTTYVPYSAFITNGGFESGTFSGWNVSGNTNSTAVVSNDVNYVHSGTYGAEMGPSATAGFLGQTIAPTAIGQLYTVSFWLSNPSAVANFFGMKWNGTSVLAMTNPPAFAFTNFQFDLVAWRPSEFLQFQFRNDPSWFGFDDVSVTPKVLVNNGGFESGDLSGWTLSGNTNEVTPSFPHLVGQWASAFGPVGSPGYISQSITTQPGQPYLISAWTEVTELDTAVPTNEFHVSWGGRSLLDLTNLPPVGWTNLHVVGLNGDAQNSLQIGIRNDPGFNFLDEISVYPQPMVRNGGFEFGDFTGWAQSGNLGSTFISTNKLYASSGYYGAEFGPIGSLGFISQNVATVPGQTYLIGCTLYVQDPFTNSEFSVSWNGAVLMDVTNLGVTGQVPFEFPVTASGTNAILQFGFRNDPEFFGFDNVFVSPIPAPVFQSIARTNNFVNVSWSALPGYLYDWQYATNLTQSNWTSLRGLQFPTNFPMMGTDTNPPDSKRFYRVRLYPPPLIF